MKTRTHYSNGKLLLTGEYAILDGAKGLAIPTKFGQSLKVLSSDENVLSWKSFDEKGKLWFQASFQINDFTLKDSSNQEMAQKLLQVLEGVQALNPNFLEDSKGFEVETALDFPSNWGLGSSSTLINNVAQWAQVDAHQLLWNTFGGSGYDISSAQHDTPIIYHLDAGKPKVEIVEFNPPFKDHLFFVHLNKKQDSGKAIANYRNKSFGKAELISGIDTITEQLLVVNELDDFETLMGKHESLLSEVLEMRPIKESFSDYFGAIKSLGAWGGDFVLATGNEKTPDYFKAKGFHVVFPYSEMVL